MGGTPNRFPRIHSTGSWESRNGIPEGNMQSYGVKGQRVTSWPHPRSWYRLGSKEEPQQSKLSGAQKPCLAPAWAWRLQDPHPLVVFPSIAHVSALPGCWVRSPFKLASATLASSLTLASTVYLPFKHQLSRMRNWKYLGKVISFCLLLCKARWLPRSCSDICD